MGVNGSKAIKPVTYKGLIALIPVIYIDRGSIALKL
jgi:hypothetical protein